MIALLLKPALTYLASSLIKSGVEKLTKSKSNPSTTVDQAVLESKLKDLNLKDNQAYIAKLFLALMFDKAVFYIVKGSIALLVYLAKKTKTRKDDKVVKQIAKEILDIYESKFKQ